MQKVNFAIGLEPKQAIAYLHQKKQLVTKVVKQEQVDSALARATTISKLTSLEMTRDIYESMEKARREGKSFHQWKKTLTAEFERKGWVFGHDKGISRGIDGKLLADPKTGEYFGTPRRLKIIYRTNMQQAYSAARYQRYMENVDNAPYWQYSAVSDQRSRPAHQALNGKIYRYDDPFWATFFPPNGFNCRCTVIALGELDLKRKGIDEVGSSEALLVNAKRPQDKFGHQEETIGFKLPDGTVRLADKGFDYNVGRLTYKPNLDVYPEKLAHQFAKAEMNGGEFKRAYDWLKDKIAPKLPEYKALKNRDQREIYLKNLRNTLERNFKFASGLLTDETRKLLNTQLKTVWLSDDSLIKQIAHREGQFGIETYNVLPEILRFPDEVKSKKDKHFEFYKTINGRRYLVVIKVLEEAKEIYMQSFRMD
ncbi:phage head morphogenesis protein [Histophilus somni]|uniref:Minor capsid protein n=1 Tax=Histophilus somni TaxID=731 RepID=A0A9Q6P4H9_HISSO|nr:phage minor head protein [Histophilus somni]ARU67347.1 phage head morphogenesis protein [Histophilus somni]ARU69227.1 phage head morphogenesis protein [Histophilus somni]ARU71104.1 phage head morphogenesis protein [Histophilus somni]ARU72975.1 phage head morphogenesis protein [Histophilus somni]ARU75335.1 phage head morphogenesis protein [Histophilus somni]